MSFVYAFKYKNNAYMFGDTKVTINENSIDNFQDEKTLVKNFGILKTIILSKQIALGFVSNNLKVVEETLQIILGKYYNIDNIDILINILISQSCLNNNSTDFILVFKSTIYKISNGKCKEENVCYIGSNNMFRFLQKEKKNKEITPSLMFSIIKLGIENNIDDTVGKFCIQIKYDTLLNKFEYIENFCTIASKTKHIKSKEIIPICDNAEDGGFTYNLFPIENENSNQFQALEIQQLKKIYAFIPLNSQISNKFKCYFKSLFLPYDITDKFQE